MLHDILTNRPDDAQVLQLFCCNPDVYPYLLQEYNKAKFDDEYSKNLRVLKNEYNPNCQIWVDWQPKHWGANAYLISREGCNTNLMAFRKDYTTIDFRRTIYPTNPEAIAYSQLKAYTLVNSMFLTRDNVESTVHNDHVSDFTYSNFMVKMMRNLHENGPRYLVVNCKEYTENIREIVQCLNREGYMKIYNTANKSPDTLNACEIAPIVGYVGNSLDVVFTGVVNTIIFAQEYNFQFDGKNIECNSVKECVNNIHIQLGTLQRIFRK